MAAGKLRGVVCTSSLDLGIDWGDVDLVINVGAPKGASRLMQRIGRANHRLDEASRAVLVPANRFEVLECRAAIDAVARERAGYAAAAHRRARRAGAARARLRLRRAVSLPTSSMREVLTRRALCRASTRDDFDDAVDFVATGGYALKTYERFARIKQDKQGRWRVANPRVRQSYRLNVGTIVEEPMLKVRLVRARGGGTGSTGALGARRPHARRDRGIFHRGAGARRHLRVRRRDPALRGARRRPGLRLARQRQGRRKCRPMRAASFRSRPISPSACASCSTTSAPGARCRIRCATGCRCRAHVSRVPGARDLLVETFPRGDKHYLVCYPFEGRLAHQTLGMLLTRRMERARAAAARLRRQRIRAGGLGARRHVVHDPAGQARSRRAVRSGHAGRRSRGLACRNPR